MRMNRLSLMGWMALGMTAVSALPGCVHRRAVPDPDTADCNGECADPEVTAPQSTPPDTVEVPRPSTSDRGMTWRLNRRFPEAESVDVGCGSEPGRCDAYTGDTTCDTALPLLCFKDLNAPLPAGLEEPNRYHMWSGGTVRLSKAYAPSESIATIADATAICAAEFGGEWRLATFHDGAGWNFRAFGELNEVEVRVDRFWVDIADQRDGTCWTR